MTKTILAGAMALALSTGAAFAATPQPATTYDNAPQAQQSSHYAYMTPRDGTPGYSAPVSTAPSSTGSSSGGMENYSGPTPFGSGGNG